MRRSDYINNDEAPKVVAENKLVVIKGVKPESTVYLEPIRREAIRRARMYDNLVLRDPDYVVNSVGPTAPAPNTAQAFRLSYSNTSDPSEEIAMRNNRISSSNVGVSINEEDDGF